MMNPHQLASIIGGVALGLVAASSPATAAWVARGGSDAKFGWLEASRDEHFTGPLLQCVDPGKVVAFSVTVGEGFKEGQTATVRVSNGADAVEMSGEVEESPVDFSLGTTIDPSHKVLRLFQGTGSLTVQVGRGPKATYSLQGASAAFAKFAKACGLAGGRAAAPSNASLVRIAIPQPSPGRIPSHFNGAM